MSDLVIVSTSAAIVASVILASVVLGVSVRRDERRRGKVGPVFAYCPKCGKQVENQSMDTAYDPMTGRPLTQVRWVQCPDYLFSDSTSEHYYRELT